VVSNNFLCDSVEIFVWFHAITQKFQHKLTQKMCGFHTKVSDRLSTQFFCEKNTKKLRVYLGAEASKQSPSIVTHLNKHISKLHVVCLKMAF
jgi:hypothetical protein